MSVEFLGMLPIILITVVLLWQCALVGYTYSLAGNSADQAARQVATTEAWQSWQGRCEQAAKSDLSGAWQQSAQARCWNEPGLVKAKVDLKVPVLFPGSINFPFTVTGNAAVAAEG
ncbi:TadE family protein [Streptomyces sp. TP-A0874]|uniref:TadE family protein n=1 Tax=Streptomyces sp. TP-A0874 TaxID=549819 RepID=UPI001FCDD030|nr:TadE family protein [Streptomyces sp. TP-A0874]